MAINTPIQVNVTLSLREVKCLDFSLSDYAQQNKKAISPDSFEFEFNLETSLNDKEKTLTYNFTTKLFEKKDAVKFELAGLKSLTVFHIINFDEIIVKNPNGLLGAPDPLLTTCASISLSHTRGMYAVKLENSIYTNAIVPVIDARLFVPKQLEQLA